MSSPLLTVVTAGACRMCALALANRCNRDKPPIVLSENSFLQEPAQQYYVVLGHDKGFVVLQQKD